MSPMIAADDANAALLVVGQLCAIVAVNVLDAPMIALLEQMICA